MCTVGGAGREKSPSDPMFACHKTVEGREQICAGWLAVAGWEHLRVRVMVLEGKVLGTALQPGPDWPELFDTYEEMAEVQGG